MGLLLFRRCAIAWRGTAVVQGHGTQKSPHLPQALVMQDMATWQFRVCGKDVRRPCLREVNPFLHGPLSVPVNNVPVRSVEVTWRLDVPSPVFHNFAVAGGQEVPCCMLACKYTFYVAAITLNSGVQWYLSEHHWYHWKTHASGCMGSEGLPIMCSLWRL